MVGSFVKQISKVINSSTENTNISGISFLVLHSSHSKPLYRPPPPKKNTFTPSIIFIKDSVAHQLRREKSTL